VKRPPRDGDRTTDGGSSELEGEEEREKERRTQSSRRTRAIFPHLCVQNDNDDDDARPTYVTGCEGARARARGRAERRRAVGRRWWRALIIPRHAIAIRELPNQPPCVARASVVLDHPFRVSCAAHAHACRAHKHTRTHFHARVDTCACTPRASAGVNLDTDVQRVYRRCNSLG